MMLPDNLDWRVLCKSFFGIMPYEYQASIIEQAFDPSARKITIRATTRAGKSYCMAMVAILRAVLLDNHKVGVVAPTYDKTRIIMNYIADMLASNPMFDDIVMIDATGLSKLERLRKEVSKKRLTFKNGSSIETKSVDLDSRGFGAMGHAYDTTIVDETDEIDDESYSKVYRMLVEAPDAKLIEIGNPWRLAHFHEHHYAEDWAKIQIHWQDCVDAGRMTEAAVEDQRRELTALEFRVLFDAEFPDEIEHAVFDKDAIALMTREKAYPKFESIIIGVDVARGGRDRTVITPIGKNGKDLCMLGHASLDTRDTMQVAGAVAEIVATRFQGKKVTILVDAVGTGAGVADRLRETGLDAKDFIAGRRARDDKRFFNYKTEVAFKVAEMAKAGLIWNVPPASKYALQLRSWTFEVRSDRQLRIIDPEDKSPDEADSLLIALSGDIYHEDLFAEGLEFLRPERARGIPRSRDHLRPRA